MSEAADPRVVFLPSGVGHARGSGMATTVLFEEQLEIPLNLSSLADFRRWATSDVFPERGRIDYVGGESRSTCRPRISSATEH